MAVQIVNRELIDALVRARVIDDPRYVRRVVIDIQYGHPARIYVERFGEDHRLVDVIDAVGIEIKQQETASLAS